MGNLIGFEGNSILRKSKFSSIEVCGDPNTSCNIYSILPNERFGEGIYNHMQQLRFKYATDNVGITDTDLLVIIYDRLSKFKSTERLNKVKELIDMAIYLLDKETETNQYFIK